MTRRRFVVLDRDGTLIMDKHYLANPDQVELMPDAVDSLRRLRQLNLGIIVVSNQSGIARGYFTAETVEQVHQRLRDLLAADGLAVDGIYFCPHVDDDGCTCRKPKPALVERAARELDFDPTACFVVGDRDADMGLAHNIGAVGILVRTGYGAEEEPFLTYKPFAVADNLSDATAIIAHLLSHK